MKLLRFLIPIAFTFMLQCLRLWRLSGPLRMEIKCVISCVTAGFETDVISDGTLMDLNKLVVDASPGVPLLVPSV